MLKKIIFISIIVSLLFSPVFSQIYKGKGKMKGTVTDEQGKPIDGVKVKLYNLKAQAGFNTKTDKEGVWRAFFIRGGQWNIDFIKEGYQIKKITSPLVKESGGKLYKIETKMKKIIGTPIKKDVLKEYEEGDNLYNQGKYKEALKIFKKIIKENESAYIINISAGNCYMRLEDYDKAIEAYKKVIEKDPKNKEAIIAIGNCYGNKNDGKNAMIWYNKTDATTVTDPIVLYNIGVFNLNANKSEEAAKFFKLAIKIDDKYLDAYYQLGISYLGLAKMKEAIGIFNKYLKIDKDSKRRQEVIGLIKDLGGTVEK